MVTPFSPFLLSISKVQTFITDLNTDHIFNSSDELTGLHKPVLPTPLSNDYSSLPALCPLTKTRLTCNRPWPTCHPFIDIRSERPITCRQILQSISCNRQRSRARHISQNEQVQSARLDRRTGLFPIRGPSDSSLNGGIWTALYEGPLTIYLRITHTPLEHQGYGFGNPSHSHISTRSPQLCVCVVTEELGFFQSHIVEYWVTPHQNNREQNK